MTSAAPVLLYRGGIASGKTVAGCVRSIVRRYQYPGTIQLVGGPSWDQVRDGTMRTLRRLLNPRCIVYENKVEHLWRLDNGSELMFRTLDDPDVLRSLEFHDIYIDENALLPVEALDVALGRIRLAYPDRSFRHALWGTTTPRGMDYTLDVWGREGRPADGYEVVHSTIYDNRDNLPPGYIERLEAKYRDTPFFAQELLGEYTAFEGLVYPQFTREQHVRQNPRPLEACRRVVVGVDWGGIVPTAMVLIGEQPTGRLHVYDEYYRVGADLGDIAATLARWADRASIEHHELVVVCDTSEQVSIATLAAQGFAATGAVKDRDAGIRLVSHRLQVAGEAPGLTVHPSCVNLINEFGQYVWASKQDSRTKVRYFGDRPVDHHADALDACRYAILELAQSEPPPRLVRTAAGNVYETYE